MDVFIEDLVHPNNSLNCLDAKSWITETITVWTQKGLGANHPDTKIEKEHPAPFSFTDISRLIRFFTKKNDTVLDPFVGIGSTLKACALENRNGIGFELNSRYVNLSKKRMRDEIVKTENNNKQSIFLGDARKLADKLDDNSIDFIVTSPPYWNILHKQDHKVKQERISKNLDTKYSDNNKDLGNIKDYNVFLDELTSILCKCKQKLKPKKYMALIVSDFRDKSRFVMFHADLANRLQNHGMGLRGITILYQKHKRVFPYGYPYAYVPNIHHQYILIMQKEISLK